ncbi:MAG TPA: SHOCT domain-containing protein [Actinomycetota bacterium]|jgi:putative membrane protein|nr:SHOCT domain-containing protein [Actinomycetota bacterium]
MPFLWLAFLALIVAGIVLLLRRPEADGRTEARRILEERFARGEIDEEEFRRRLEVLSGSRR